LVSDPNQPRLGLKPKPAIVWINYMWTCDALYAPDEVWELVIVTLIIRTF